MQEINQLLAADLLASKDAFTCHVCLTGRWLKNILRGFQQASALQLPHHLLGLILVKGLPRVNIKVDS